MKEINEWEVLTPDGWQDFSGIIELEKKVKTITFQSGKEITASESHRLLLESGDFIELKNLMIGDIVVSKDGNETVAIISKLKEDQKVYDLVGVESEKHRYYTNGLISHNCDEMAFIPARIQDEFMAGTAPALSATRGKMIITSTPNGSRDLFAKLWFGSGMEFDKKEYTYVRKNVARNDFVPLFIPYWIDETKNNEEWISREKRTLDDPVKWKVEFECLGRETEVEVYDKISKEYKTISLKEMYMQLEKDVIDSKFIIEEEKDKI